MGYVRRNHVRISYFVVQTRYGSQAPGRLLGECCAYVAGRGDVRGVVLFEFSSMEKARRWYNSAAYRDVKKRRDGAAGFDLMAGKIKAKEAVLF
jgi:uncharacterized protein (DUF1330 family)